jgi:hypothetical protein
MQADERRRSREGEHIEPGRDAFELGAVVAHLDVADRADVGAAATTAAGALVALPRAGTATATEAEACLRNRNHRHALSLNRLAEDRRHLRPLADRLSDPLE